MSHFAEYLLSAAWAMDQDRAEAFRVSLEGILDNKVDLEVLEAYKSQRADAGERLKVRDGVGILYVEGPLFKRANFMTAFCGATSYDVLLKDLQAAVDDPNLHSIAMWVDSPGGEANGCDEVANAIYAARKIKPITSFVSGMAASGGYWIASSASEMYVSDAAVLGSIGVVLGIQDRTDAEAKRGVKTVQFVSSQSPGKRPDPSTEEGKNRIQTMVNDLADVFVSAVARNRGVTPETVIKEFGAGGVEVGAKAVARGMADKIGSFEGVLASLATSGKKGRVTRYGGFNVSEENNGPTAAEIAATARTEAQARIKGITQASIAGSLGTLAAFLAFDTQISQAESIKIMEAAAKDLDAKPAAAAEPENQPEAGAGDRNYAQHKEGSGALGLARPDAAGGDSGATAAADGWKKAVANVNQGMGFQN